MKNIKYVYKFLLVLPLVFMAGCIGSDDYEDVLSNQSTQQSTVFIETDDASEITHVAPINSEQTIEVGINNSQTDDLTVSFNVTKNGAVAVEGVDYDLADSVVESGDYFGSSIVSFYTEGTYEVTVKSAGALEVVGNRAIFFVPPLEEITVTLKWADDSYDLDLELDAMSETWGWNGTIAGSYGFSNVETVTLDIVDGNYAFWIYDWSFTGDDVDYIIEIEINGNLETFTGTENTTGWYLWMTFGRDADLNPVFTFYEEDPS